MANDYIDEDDLVEACAIDFTALLDDSDARIYTTEYVAKVILRAHRKVFTIVKKTWTIPTGGAAADYVPADVIEATLTAAKVLMENHLIRDGYLVDPNLKIIPEDQIFDDLTLAALMDYLNETNFEFYNLEDD